MLEEMKSPQQQPPAQDKPVISPPPAKNLGKL